LEQKVLANGVNRELIRFVTHLDVSREQCARALEAVASICAAPTRRG
jgi:threonine aldolase